MPGYSQRLPTVCAFEVQLWNAILDVIKPYVLSKGYSGMPHPRSSNLVYFSKEMIECLTQHRLFVCAVKV